MQAVGSAKPGSSLAYSGRCFSFGMFWESSQFYQLGSEAIILFVDVNFSFFAREIFVSCDVVIFISLNMRLHLAMLE